MKTMVIGSKELSCIILDTLLRHGCEVLAVYTRDDEPGMKVWHGLGHRSLAKHAASLGIPVYEGMKVNSGESLKLIADLNPAVIFSCFWSELFRPPLLTLPAMGVFNFHTAFLPKNRGSRPIPWAIIKGEHKTGITLHRMESGVDNGPIADQEAIEITDVDTAKSVYSRLMVAAEKMFERALPSFINGNIELKAQDEDTASYQLRGEPYGGQINHFWSEDEKDRFVRAMHFPPFRAHRQAPQQTAKPGVKVILNGQNAVDIVDLGDTERFRSNLTGGDASLRRELRALISEARNALARLLPALDLQQYLPVLEALKLRKYEAVISTIVPNGQLSQLRLSQPHRLSNGLLEIPLTIINNPVEFTNILQEAVAISKEINTVVYVNIAFNDAASEDCLRILLLEKMKTAIDVITYDDVCAAYNTPYEDIST